MHNRMAQSNEQCRTGAARPEHPQRGADERRRQVARSAHARCAAANAAAAAPASCSSASGARTPLCCPWLAAGVATRTSTAMLMAVSAALAMSSSKGSSLLSLEALREDAATTAGCRSTPQGARPCPAGLSLSLASPGSAAVLHLQQRRAEHTLQGALQQADEVLQVLPRQNRPRRARKLPQRAQRREQQPPRLGRRGVNAVGAWPEAERRGG